jgi:hypothetical protein
MGIGLVLLAWLVFWLVVAIIASPVLGLLTRRWVKGAKKGQRIRAVIAACLLPPVAIISAFAGFVGYGVWCETIRGVDAGIGDGWRAPLGSGYYLEMIDTPTDPFVIAPSGKQFGFGFLGIGHDDEVIYLETKANDFLLVEKATGDLSSLSSRAELDGRLRQLGSSPSAFKSGFDTYRSLRWGLVDLLAIPLVLGIPLLLTSLLAAYIRKLRKSAATQPLPRSG